MTDSRASDIIGQRIKEVRQRRGWTAKQLADRCSEIGSPELTTSVIANIETGRRDSHGQRRRDVTVDELLVLAYALEVPPVLLFLPLDGRDRLQITPEKDLDVVHAAAWVDGDEAGFRALADQVVPVTDADRERRARWWRNTQPLNELRSIWLWLQYLQGRPAADGDNRTLLEEIALASPEDPLEILTRVARMIDFLAARGFTPPPLPAGIVELLRSGKVPLDYSGDLLIADDETP